MLDDLMLLLLEQFQILIVHVPISDLVMSARGSVHNQCLFADMCCGFLEEKDNSLS